MKAAVEAHRRNLDKNKIPLNVIVLGIVSLFTDAASEMIYPLVPIFVASLGSGAVILGVIEGVAETTAAMLKLFSGIISDKLQKRKLYVRHEAAQEMKVCPSKSACWWRLQTALSCMVKEPLWWR